MSTRRFLVAALAAFVFAAGCGDDGDAAGDDAPAIDDGGGDDAASDADGGQSDGTSSSDGAGTATATIGGEQFDFDQELVCIALGGAVSGSFSDGEGVELSIDVPPEDWETSTTGDWEAPTLTLRDERDEENWRIFESGPSLEGLFPGTRVDEARITDFSVDGDHATGNGLVIDTWGITLAGVEGTPVPEPVPVTFGFECS